MTRPGDPNNDWSGDGASVSAAIIAVVSDEAGVDPVVLPPLYDQIDPDALDTLFASKNGDLCRTGSVTFVYAGYVVEVVCDGEPTITLDEHSPDAR